MIIYPTNLTEAEQLLEYLNNNKDIKPGKSDSEILINVFNDTEYNGLRNLIALILSKQKNEAFFLPLILKIRASIHTNYLTGLLSAAARYDCAGYLQVFIDIIILKSSMAYWSAIYVIEHMDLSGISVENAEYAVNKLDAHLETLDKSDKKFAEVNAIAKYFESFDNYDD